MAENHSDLIIETCPVPNVSRAYSKRIWYGARLSFSQVTKMLKFRYKKFNKVISLLMAGVFFLTSIGHAAPFEQYRKDSSDSAHRKNLFAIQTLYSIYIDSEYLDRNHPFLY